MRETARLSLLLAAICAVCGALLVFVDGRTSAARKATAARKLAASAEALFGVAAGGPVSFERRDAPGGGTVFVLRDTRRSPSFAGAAIVGTSQHGYAGEIKLLVAFDADGRLVDFNLLEGHETPGLGAKIARPDFRRGFAGRPFNGTWKVRKDGGDIDAVTSATISSRAAAEAVADAASRFEGVRAAALAGMQADGEGN